MSGPQRSLEQSSGLRTLASLAFARSARSSTLAIPDTNFELMPRFSRAQVRRWRAMLIGVPIAGLLFALLFPLVYALSVREERGPVYDLPSVPQSSYMVMVVDWGYHTAIVVEQPRDWALGPSGDEQAPFVEYAWGDRRFYMESDYRPHAVVAALVLPTESVLYVRGHSRPPSFDGARAVSVRSVDAGALHGLLVELERSFQRSGDGSRLAPHPVVRGFAGRFYPAYGRYMWTRDCNWWTVTRLHAGQLAGTARSIVFSGQVISRLHGFRAAAPLRPLGPQR